MAAMQESAMMRAINGIVLVGGLAAMVAFTPLLAEFTRPYVGGIIQPRYSREASQWLMTTYEVLVWPAVFLVARGLLTLVFVSLGLVLLRRSFDYSD